LKSSKLSHQNLGLKYQTITRQLSGKEKRIAKIARAKRRVDMALKNKSCEMKEVLSIPHFRAMMCGVSYIEKYKNLTYVMHYVDGSTESAKLEKDIPFDGDTNAFSIVSAVQSKRKEIQ